MESPTDPAPPSRAVVEAAAMWHARLGDEDCEASDRREFEAWLGADATHRTAFDRMEAIAGRLQQQDAVGSTALRRSLSRRPRGAAAIAVLALGIASLMGWLALQSPLVRSRMAEHHAAIGEIRAIRLADGDQITLDSGSAADVDEGGRTIRLWRGAVMAQVRKGRQEPFVIRTPQGTARALGTRFSVRIADDAALVYVFESRVEACAEGGSAACVTLAAGQAAQLDSRGVHRLADIDPEVEGAWSEKLLIAEDMPLVQVIDRLNDYRAEPIYYDAANLERLRVSGAFPVTDAPRALASISQALPVRVEENEGSITVRRK